jgi:hypothetical protein
MQSRLKSCSISEDFESCVLYSTSRCGGFFRNHLCDLTFYQKMFIMNARRLS